MSEITGGELLVRCLANEGVRFVFGLPCPEVDPILASLEPHGLRLVPVRHEAAREPANPQGPGHDAFDASGQGG